MAEHQPVLFILEDLHWTDPTTLEFLTLLIDQAPTASIYTLLTCRREFQPPWSHRSYLTEVTVHRLSREEIARMAVQIAVGKTLPDEVLQQIVDKTDGVPLFVEELTKAVLESGHLKEVDGHSAVTETLPALAIPSTLQDSDGTPGRLVTERRIAQWERPSERILYALLQASGWITTLAQLGRLVEADLCTKGIAAAGSLHIQTCPRAGCCLCIAPEEHPAAIISVSHKSWKSGFGATVTQPELLAHHPAGGTHGTIGRLVQAAG
jgi:hypothetical protein